MTELLVIVSLLVLIAVAAPRYGVDSRFTHPVRRVRPVDDLRTAAGAVRGLVSRGGRP